MHWQQECKEGKYELYLKNGKVKSHRKSHNEFLTFAVVLAELHALKANFKHFAKRFKMIRAWLQDQEVYLHIQHTDYSKKFHFYISNYFNYNYNKVYT